MRVSFNKYLRNLLTFTRCIELPELSQLQINKGHQVITPEEVLHMINDPLNIEKAFPDTACKYGQQFSGTEYLACYKFC